MKKMIAMILALMLTLTLFGCGSDEPKETVGGQQSGQTDVQDENTENDSPKETEPPKQDWGIECDKYVDSGDVRVYVSFPDSPGVDRSTGLLCRQSDSTMAAFDAYVEGRSPEVENIKDLFPAYGEQMMDMFADAYGHDYDNNSIEVEYNGTETIGSYEVTKFKGVHNYTEEDLERSRQFVVYAVQLHKGGAYAYVMVQDNSKDQSQLKLIENHAANMILSLRED